MRYTGAALVAALACGLVGSADEAEKYVSKDGGYAVQFPPGAEVAVKTQDAPGGLKAVVTTALLKADRQTYVVVHTPHTKGVLKAAAKAVLAAGEKATLAPPGTAKVAVKDFTFGREKFPARDVLTDRDGNQTRTRFILADPKLYTLVVGGPKEFASGPEADAFLDSFELVPAGKGKK